MRLTDLPYAAVLHANQVASIGQSLVRLLEQNEKRFRNVQQNEEDLPHTARRAFATA